MKKLSLMLALVLALGLFATACSDDDAAVLATFEQASAGSAVFFDNDSFTVLNFTDGKATSGWKGAWVQDEAILICIVDQWLVEVENSDPKEYEWTDVKPTSGLESFVFTMDADTFAEATSAVLSITEEKWDKVD